MAISALVAATDAEAFFCALRRIAGEDLLVVDRATFVALLNKCREFKASGGGLKFLGSGLHCLVFFLTRQA